MIRSIVVASGGTGGHISPGIALAETLVEHKEKYKMDFILIHSVKRNLNNPDLQNPPCPVIWHDSPRLSKWNFLIFPILFLKNLIITFYSFRKFKVDAVISMGGYSSLPSLIYALLFRKKIFLCEQNCVVGRVNKLFWRFADKVALSFPLAKPNDLKRNWKVIGNPVRKKIIPNISVKVNKEFSERKKEKLNVLVMGGSQGSRQINNMVIRSMENDEIAKKINFRMLTGTSLYEEAKKKSAKNLDLISYSIDMKSHYEWANLVIARSGAGVLSECTIFAIPMILIPYPFAADNHQEANARYFETNGAAFVISRRDEDEAELVSLLLSFLSDMEILNEASKKSLSLSRVNASYETVHYFIEAKS